ncbi:unnamed protein product [Brassicogethes aeneus]|uniref:SHSP domain-containing protein n=1 Tax=Brassicogethes aeneus TaxID=1431903 RepID=A0A9P0FCS2_BRAAE|nr:unnamed protein product [Brassicogethes aeneus]
MDFPHMKTRGEHGKHHHMGGKFGYHRGKHQQGCEEDIDFGGMFGKHIGKHHGPHMGKPHHGKHMRFGGDLECGPHMGGRHMGKHHGKHLRHILGFGKDIEFNKDPNTFKLFIAVQDFQPEGITVTVNENTITVEGKHDEKEVSNGTIARSFTRKIVLPDEYDVSKLASKYLPNGFLSITAPRIGSEIITEARDIPVIRSENVTDMLQSRLSL